MEKTEALHMGKIYHCLEYSYDQTGELFLIACGHEKCTPHIITGPDVRKAYHLHVVLSGKGTLFAGDKEFHPHFGQMFLLISTFLNYLFFCDLFYESIISF